MYLDNEVTGKKTCGKRPIISKGFLQEQVDERNQEGKWLTQVRLENDR